MQMVCDKLALRAALNYFGLFCLVHLCPVGGWFYCALFGLVLLVSYKLRSQRSCSVALEASLFCHANGLCQIRLRALLLLGSFAWYSLALFVAVLWGLLFAVFVYFLRQ